MKKVDNQRKSKHWTLIYIKEGIGMYMLGSSLLTLNKGDMLILPSLVDYSFSDDDLGDEYNINIDARVIRFYETWLDDMIKVFPVLSSVVLNIKEIKKPLAVTGPKWMKIASLFENFDDDQPQMVLNLLKQISTDTDVVNITDIVNPDDGNVFENRKEMIDRYLSCNLCSTVRLEDVASYVGMNRISFCMFFKRHYHENFSDYMNRKRIEQSCQLLSATAKDLSSIAGECGFKTVPYFTRVFSRVMGVSPAKFRKMHVFAKP